MSVRVGLDDQQQQQRRTQAGSNNQRKNNYNKNSSRGRGGGPSSTRRRGNSPSAASTTSTASDIEAINAELEDENFFRSDAIDANFMSNASFGDTGNDGARFADDAAQNLTGQSLQHGGDPNAANAILYDTSVHPSVKFHHIAQNFLKRLHANKPAVVDNAIEASNFGDAEQNSGNSKPSSTQQSFGFNKNAGGNQQQKQQQTDGHQKTAAASKADKRKVKNSNDAFYRDWRITFNTATQYQHDHNGVLFNVYDLFMIGNVVAQNVIRNAYVRNAYANLFLVWFANYLQRLVAAVKAAENTRDVQPSPARTSNSPQHAPELPVLSSSTRTEIVQIFTDPTRVSVLPLLRKLLIHEADWNHAKQVFLTRVREVLSCHYIFVYAFQTAQVIRAFDLYEDVMLSPAEAAASADSPQPREPIEPLVKLMNSMVMVGGNAAAYLVDFVDKQPALQVHLARTLDMIVGQYERYEHDWHQLRQGDFFAHDDKEKTMLSSQKAGKQPLVKKEIVSQVYALMRRYSLPSHVAEFSEYQRKFSYLTYLIYNFDKESQQPTHDDVRFEEKVDAVCANNDVLRKNFLEYLLTRRKFDIFVTLYVLWMRRFPSGTLSLQIPSFLQRQLRERQTLLKDLQHTDVDRQLWHIIQGRQPSTCALSEYCREFKPTSFADSFNTAANPYLSSDAVDYGAAAESKMLRYLPLDLTFAQVKFISTRIELVKFIEQLRTMAQDFRAKTMLKQQATGEIADAAILVGIDCEWFDDMGVTNENLSLIQIGLGDRVFIVDMLRILAELNSNTIANEERREIWSKFSHTLFLDPIFRKILYSGQHDFTVLGRIDGFVEPNDYNKQNIVDLYQIFRILKVYKPACLGLRDDEQCGSGLKDLTRLVLGAELDKTEQTSGWLRRPLRLMQVIYAALDAHVLILLYDKLKQNCQRDNVPFPPNVSDAHRLANANVMLKHAAISSSDADTSHNLAAAAPAITPDEIKMLVEAHLQGLARQLRSCGIDTLVASEGEQRRVTVRRAVEQNRTLIGTNDMRGQYKECLLDDQLYLLLPKHVQQKRCRDQCKYVLQYFNVLVREDDILTRCVGCNGVQYMSISAEQLRVLWQRHHDEQQARWNEEDERRKQDALDGWGEYASSSGATAVKNLHETGGDVQQPNDDEDDEDEEDEDGRALTDVSKRYRFVSKSSSTAPLPVLATVPSSVENCEKVRQCFEKAIPYCEELVDMNGCICGDSSAGGGARVKLKLGAVPEGVLNSVDLFFVCMQCGKIYWNGTHFMRIRTKFLADVSPTTAADDGSSTKLAMVAGDGRVALENVEDHSHDSSMLSAYAGEDDITDNGGNSAGARNNAEIPLDNELSNDSKINSGRSSKADNLATNDAARISTATTRGFTADTQQYRQEIVLDRDNSRDLLIHRDLCDGNGWNADTSKYLKRPERFISPSIGNGNGVNRQFTNRSYNHNNSSERRFEQQQYYQQRPHQPTQPSFYRTHHQPQQQYRFQPPTTRPPLQAEKDGFKIPRAYSYEHDRFGKNSGGASASPPRSRSKCAEYTHSDDYNDDDVDEAVAPSPLPPPSSSPKPENTPSGNAYAVRSTALQNNSSGGSGEHDETAGLSVYMRFGRTGLSGNSNGNNGAGSGSNGKIGTCAVPVTSASASPMRTSKSTDHYSPYEREGRIPPPLLQSLSSNTQKNDSLTETSAKSQGAYHAQPNAPLYAEDTSDSFGRQPSNNHAQIGRGWITDSFFSNTYNGGAGRGRARADAPYSNPSPSYGSGSTPPLRLYEERNGGGSRAYSHANIAPVNSMTNNNYQQHASNDGLGRGQQRSRDTGLNGQNSSGRFNNGKRPNEFYQQQQIQSMLDVEAGNINWRGERQPRQ